MATNRHATIRYNTLDYCFGNFGRRYTIDDLLDACNNAIYEFTGKQEGIKKRQLYDDIRFMESDQGWSIPLQRIKEGRKVFFHYDDKNFSIRNQALSTYELQQLSDTLSLLSRFKGMPHFEWVEETIIRFQTALHMKPNTHTIVGFEQNPYLHGLNHFANVFNAALYKRAAEVTYQGFKQANPETYLFHPYYLKQYNNRWFIFGWNEQAKRISNLALDRILQWKEADANFIENESLNFEEFFEDAIGVSINEEQQPAKITLEINSELWPYIKTKPLHGSQKTKSITEDGVTIELSVLINYELISTILSFGEKIKVVNPEELKHQITEVAKQMLRHYE